MGFMITADGTPGSTQVSNRVLLKYLLLANGEHVKVYLYLLMAFQNPGLVGSVSVESLADRLDCTERDIVRALKHWERENLIRITWNGELVEGINLLNIEETVGSSPVEMERTFTETGTPHLKVLRSDVDVYPERHIPDQTDIYEESYDTHSNNENTIPERSDYSEDVIDALSKDVEMQKTLSGVEKALGSPLTPQHMQLVMYLMCDLGFPGSLVIYLYELASGRGKLKPKYIETIAINWAKSGINSVEQARQESDEFSGKYAAIKTALGRYDNFTPAEKEIIDGWFEYGFDQDVIIEACNRTVLNTGGGKNLKYISKILKNWSTLGVHSVSDIADADEEYKKKNSEKAKNNTRVARNVSRNAFQNFKQREYSDEDYEALERQMLRRSKSQ